MSGSYAMMIYDQRHRSNLVESAGDAFEAGEEACDVIAVLAEGDPDRVRMALVKLGYPNADADGGPVLITDRVRRVLADHAFYEGLVARNRRYAVIGAPMKPRPWAEHTEGLGGHFAESEKVEEEVRAASTAMAAFEIGRREGWADARSHIVGLAIGAEREVFTRERIVNAKAYIQAQIRDMERALEALEGRPLSEEVAGE
jgi:hypothetical protein